MESNGLIKTARAWYLLNESKAHYQFQPLNIKYFQVLAYLILTFLNNSNAVNAVFFCNQWLIPNQPGCAIQHDLRIDQYTFFSIPKLLNYLSYQSANLLSLAWSCNNYLRLLIVCPCTSRYFFPKSFQVWFNSPLKESFLPTSQ